MRWALVLLRLLGVSSVVLDASSALLFSPH
jgi:hypothetical protein